MLIKPPTSLRFFAALMVLCHHYFGFIVGFLGVTFLSVLSGYILTVNYAGKVGSWAEIGLFWWKRFARIYPMHLLTLAAALPHGPRPARRRLLVRYRSLVSPVAPGFA